MKFDKKHRIYAAAAREKGRYAIDSILFERDDNGARLVATNGRILAVVPVDEAEDDVPGPIDQDAIRAACKGKTKARPDAHVRLADDKFSLVTEKNGLSQHARPEARIFPEWKAVVPKAKNPTSITLSARYLLDLADALGVMGDPCDGITLTFDIEDGKIDGGVPVRVDAANGAYGVIMPIEGK